MPENDNNNEVVTITTTKESYSSFITGIIIAVFLLAALIIILVYFRKKQNEYNGYYVYTVDAKDSKVMCMEYMTKNSNGKGLIEEFLNAMQEEPDSMSMKKAIPDNVKLDDYDFSANGDLTLYFNSSYGNYTGVSEILRRAAIVKTLCQVKDVRAVQFYVAGQPLIDSNLDAVGYMNDDSFIDNTGTMGEYQKKANIYVYYGTSDGKKLKKFKLSLKYDAVMTLEQLVVNSLIEGPGKHIHSGRDKVIATVPGGTKINHITIKEHTCYVDLSKEFLSKPDKVTPEVAIYSVVNSLTELPDVNNVCFSIDGEQVLSYNDTIHLGEIFQRNLDIVSE